MANRYNYGYAPPTNRLWFSERVAMVLVFSVNHNHHKSHWFYSFDADIIPIQLVNSNVYRSDFLVCWHSNFILSYKTTCEKIFWGRLFKGIKKYKALAFIFYESSYCDGLKE